MTTAIRITVEHYNTLDNTILSRKNINDQAVIKPIDMVDLGYQHIEQIQMLMNSIYRCTLTERFPILDRTKNINF